MDVVKAAEAIAAAAVKPRKVQGRDEYLEHLAGVRFDLKELVRKTERRGQTELQHRFLLLLSEVDQLETDLKGEA